ncbi:MAG TPA: nucleotide exchange factor GrpE [Candidatus Polarisedimenticolaceae bacterium]|nr:nucleotide exchange factor GrpE [Candidatus Polarisedimenticolaceae bacterium]
MKPREAAPRPEDDEEIEILEIVGLDEDGLPIDPDEPALVIAEDPAIEEAIRAPLRPPPAQNEERERYLRLQSDYENYKRRVERERAESERRATAELIERLLPVVDNFERALASRPLGGSEPGFRDGVSLILRQLLDALHKAGLQPIESVGRPFDPRVHEAVSTEAGPDLPDQLVVEEFQRGYRFLERLLRPALVKVTVRTDG